MIVLFLRTLIVYVIVTMAIRIMGKRQLGELQPNEFVVTVIISNIATLSLQDNSVPILGTMLPIFTLVACEVIISFIAIKSVKIRRAISGNPIIIIKDGIINQKEMLALRWTLDDLMGQLRISNIFDINEVSLAIVETSGDLSVYPKFANRPLTPSSAGIAPTKPYQDYPPVVMISDTCISEEGLNFCGVEESWLKKILKKEGCTINQVFLMVCDKNLEYKIIKKDRK